MLEKIVKPNDIKKIPEERLPELAEEKNTRAQIAMCFDAYRDQNWMVKFD